MAISRRRAGAALRLAVIGDERTGKSSLITTVASGSFPSALVAPVLSPTSLPADLFPDGVPLTLIDTSASAESKEKLDAEVRAADAVVLCFDCSRGETLRRVSRYWLPELCRLNVTVSVIVVGCKLDLFRETESLERAMLPIMQEFRQVVTCLECSALNQYQVSQVFLFAQKAVLHPIAPLCNQETLALQPQCVRALKRIFKLADHDSDGALSDKEFNDLQVKCFNAALHTTEIARIKQIVQEKKPDGINDNGLTLTGFLMLQKMFIEKGRLEAIWSVFRKFGYDDDLKITDDLLPTSIFNCAPDQSVELTNQALEFLKKIFYAYNMGKDEALKPAEIDELFSTAPENPWLKAPYKDAAERNGLVGLSLDGFLSQWALMTLLDPALSIANLLYIGYADKPASAFRVTRQRRLDRKHQQSQRNVYQCFVFGPKSAGNCALLNALMGRTSTEIYTPTTSERYASNFVELPEGNENRKTLVMREVPEDQVKALLSNKESLAPCDVAVFVRDSSDEESWNKAEELLKQVASYGERTGFEVPCLVVPAKGDLDPYPLAKQDPTRVSQDMGIGTPIPAKLRDVDDVFRRITIAALCPHLGIPETETSRKQHLWKISPNHSLMLASVGAASAIALAAYKLYASRKSSSANRVRIKEKFLGPSI